MLLKHLIKRYGLNLVGFIKNQLRYLGVPLNLRKIYNFGFILGICLIIQFISGLLLAIMYMRGSELRFSELFKILEYTKTGFILRYIHINTVSFFFIFLYLHIRRRIYYGSYFNKKVWITGITILLLLIGIAFIGYVLPYNQISFWGASVITRLLNEIPYLGTSLVELIWGDVSVRTFTLLRFFTLHFIMPFILLFFVIIHIFFLHDLGSRNPSGLESNEKAIFNEIQILNDFTLFFLFFFLLSYIILFNRNFFGDDQNFLIANIIETPPHIQPEWYFLFAYAILRSIPNKLGGVIGLVSSIFILYFIVLKDNNNFKRISFKPATKIFFWLFIINIIFLSWIGICTVEHPYDTIGQLFRVVYFLFFFFFFFIILIYLSTIYLYIYICILYDKVKK